MSLWTEIANEPLCYRLSWTLLYSLWQGGLAALLFAITRLALRRHSANSRYIAFCAIFFLLAMGAMMTFVREPGISSIHSGSTRFIPVTSEAPGHPGQATNWHGSLTQWTRDWSVAFDRLRPFVVSLWLAGVFALAVRWLLGSAWLRRLKKVNVEPVELVWLKALERLKVRLQIERPIRLARSALVEVPTVIGWLRPVILLPASTITGLTPAQLESILAHELAHVRRYDYLVNLFQTVVEILLFYHPAVWWISCAIREEREICCDDLATSVCGDRAVYARALFTLEQLRAASPQLALAANGGSLLRRIRRLMRVPAEAPSARATEFGGVALVAVGVVLVITGLSLMIVTPIYRARAVVTVSRALPNAENENETVLALNDPFLFQTQCALIRSPRILTSVGHLLQLPEVWGREYNAGVRLTEPATIERLKKSLRVNQIPNASLIGIEFSDADPVVAAKIPNAIASEYRDYYIRERESVVRAKVERLERDLAEQDRKIVEAQREVDELQSRDNQDFDGVVSPAVLRRLETLRVDSTVEFTRAKALVSKLRTLEPETLPQALVASGTPDSLLSSFLEQRTLLDQRLAFLNQQFGREYSEVVAVSSQAQDLQAKIRSRVQGIMSGLEAKVDALEIGLENLSAEIEKAKQTEIKRDQTRGPYLTAKHHVDDLRRFRQLLYTKLAMERTDQELTNHSGVQIIEEAVAPARASAPNQARATELIGAGIIVGIMGLVVFKLERRKSSQVGS